MRRKRIAAAAVALAVAACAQAPSTAPGAAPAAGRTAPQSARIVCPSAVAGVALLAHPKGDDLLAAAPCGVGVAIMHSGSAAAGSGAGSSAGVGAAANSPDAAVRRAWVLVRLPGVATGWVERKYLAPSATALAGPLAFYAGTILGVSRRYAVNAVYGGKPNYGRFGFATIAVPALRRRYTVRCSPHGFVGGMTSSCSGPALVVGASYSVRVDRDWLWLRDGRKPNGKPRIYRYRLITTRLVSAHGH